jgi:hypothetical protein
MHRIVKQTRFSVMAQAFAGEGTRRRFLGALAGLGLGTAVLADTEPARAKNPRRQHFCLNGQTISARNKHKKRRLRRQGAVPGRCQGGCTPSCPAGGCGMDDGCGGICGCGDGALCVDAVCETCTVTCTGSASSCGTELQLKIAGGGKVYVCPGEYETAATFQVTVHTEIYGAGRGSDPDTDTILTSASGTVLNNPLALLTLSGLRITGGDGGNSAPGGINSNSPERLTIENCAIVENQGITGGLLAAGPVTISNSEISRNWSSVGPGGVDLRPLFSDTVSTISNTVIDGNEGLTYAGVIFYANHPTNSLVISNASRITNNRFTAIDVLNSAGGIGRFVGGGPLDITDTIISGNDDPQCENVPGCDD